jgi:hypothetical protein
MTDEPRPCQYCGRTGTHTTICWAIAPRKHVSRIGVATGSTDGIPDPESTDRAEDNYMAMLAGERFGPW